MPEFRDGSKTLHSALCLGILVTFLLGWHWTAAGSVTPGAVGSLLLLVGLSAGYGAGFAALTAPTYRSPAGTAWLFLVGFFIFNTAMFVLALATPFGVKINMLLLVPGAVIGSVFYVRRTINEVPAVDKVELVAVLVSCLAATVWSADALTSPLIEGGQVIYQIWPDFFIHAREISVFAQSHGLQTINDIKLAGGRVPIYHFANYLSPAAISAYSGATASQVYTSFALPVGVLLTGLAAYSLVASVFGRWPALAATLLITLGPDAYLQGFGNRYLSYYFLSQSNFGMLYGIACTAIAWVLIVEGCRASRAQLVLVGYIFIAMCLFYKAHIFVANSYVALIYPWLMYGGLRRRVRIGAVLGLSAIFVSVIQLSQSLPRVPLLKLDGSALQWYLMLLLERADPGILTSFYHKIFLDNPWPRFDQGIAAVAMILLTSFGVWSVALPLTLASRWKQLPPGVKWLPIMVLTNYLIMALGLARDTRGIGTPDELLNRPMVWAYFLITTLTTGAGYRILFGDAAPARLSQAAGAGALVLGALALTVPNAHEHQTYPVGPHPISFRQHSALPACGKQALDFLRVHSAQNAIVQPADGDPDFKITALSERQLFAGKLSFGGENATQQKRLLDMQLFIALRDEMTIRRRAADQKIDWYLLTPGTRVGWPAEILLKPEFECGEYRLIRFADAMPAGSQTAWGIPGRK